MIILDMTVADTLTLDPLDEATLHHQETGPLVRPEFRSLVDLRTGAIGRVVGSEQKPAGAHQFYFWADERILTLDVGHIVVAFSEEAAVIGVVDEPNRYSDLRSFLDDYFDRRVEEAMIFDPPSKRPEILVFAVTVLATKHLRDDVTSHRPPLAGDVFFATTDAIDFALGTKNFGGTAIPALMHTNGNAEREGEDEKLDENGNVVFQRAPIWLDEDYLLGPEAGHANWTGQSGLATKTSHALFLTSAIFQKLRAEGKTVAALMFNVKGPDLLWLDKPAIPEPGFEQAYAAADFDGLSPRDREAYQALGLNPKPFANLSIFAPFKPGQVPRADVAHLESDRDPARLNTLRNAPGQAQCVYPILWELEPFLWQPHRIFEREDLDDKLFGFVGELKDGHGIQSLAHLERLFGEIDAYFAANEGDKDRSSEWNGHHKFTIRKARNRFKNLQNKFNGLLATGMVSYGNLPQVDAPFTNEEVRVVDIAHCNTNIQEILVSSIINKVWQMAEQGEKTAKDNPARKEKALGVDKVIVFVDELNKYAPAGGQGALRDTLVDIAARGRHLSVVLFGAQQFRSKVETEILGNCGTSFYGRVGDEEIINASYRSLSDTAKAELLGLPKGQLLVRHAHFRAPLFGAFPLPPIVPGMKGQRIFNDSAGTVAAYTHPSDGLYDMLKKHMGDACPRKSEVRSETEGFTLETLADISFRVEQQWRGMIGTTKAARLNPWSIAKNALQTNRHLNRR